MIQTGVVTQTFVVTRPFPQPGRLVERAYRELDKAENGTADEKRVRKLAGAMERPWDPPSCAPALRGQVWQWLDEVAAWVNHEHSWGVERLIPPCWPAHPHIAHELAVVADLRRTAGRDTTSALLAYWHRDVLPMFLERMHLRLAGSCAAGHQDWTAAARYRAFTNDTNQAQRQAWFTADRQITFPPPDTDLGDDTHLIHHLDDGDGDGGGGEGEDLVVDTETGVVSDLNDWRQRPS